MLLLEIGGNELYDEAQNEFVTLPAKQLKLEHSLYSIHNWESKWHKPFLDSLERRVLTREELIDYIRCMTITPNVDAELYNSIDQNAINKINQYLDDPMTATTFSKRPGEGSRPHKIITAEVVYAYMFEYSIPFECRKWNFNQLMTLIRVCQINGQPAKKMSSREITASNAALNDARRKQHHTRG